MIERCVFFLKPKLTIFPWKYYSPIWVFPKFKTHSSFKSYISKQRKKKKFKAKKREGPFYSLKSVRLLIFLFLTLTFMSCFLAIVQEFSLRKKANKQEKKAIFTPNTIIRQCGGGSPHIPGKIQGLCILVEIFRGKFILFLSVSVVDWKYQNFSTFGSVR